jgi:hypothetical protein
MLASVIDKSSAASADDDYEFLNGLDLELQLDERDVHEPGGLFDLYGERSQTAWRYERGRALEAEWRTESQAYAEAFATAGGGGAAMDLLPLAQYIGAAVASGVVGTRLRPH